MSLDAVECLQATAARLNVPLGMLGARQFGSAHRRMPTTLQSRVGVYLPVFCKRLVLSCLLQLNYHRRLMFLTVVLTWPAHLEVQYPLARRAKSAVPSGLLRQIEVLLVLFLNMLSMARQT